MSYTSRRNFLTSVLSGAAVLSLGPVFDATARSAASGTILDTGKLTLGMVVFDGFQLLDTFGPLEMFGSLRDQVTILMIAEKAGSVKSSAGPSVLIDHTFETAPKIDIVMVPGGGGTRREVNNPGFLASFKKIAAAAPHVASICTGAAVLAKTGLIDGLKATTNKRAFKWASSQGEKVNWVKQARWVEDGKNTSPLQASQPVLIWHLP
jgi:putative intracellular protease/amidase